MPSLSLFGMGEGLDDEEAGVAVSERTREAVEEAAFSLIYEFQHDVARLRSGGAFGDTSMVDYLPRRYAHRYESEFAEQFLGSLHSVVDKTRNGSLLEGEDRLESVAEELAMRAILVRAQTEVDEPQTGKDLYELWDVCFEDIDFEFLFDPAADGIESSPAVAHFGMANLEFDDWFKPF